MWGDGSEACTCELGGASLLHALGEQIMCLTPSV